MLLPEHGRPEVHTRVVIRAKDSFAHCGLLHDLANPEFDTYLPLARDF